MSNVAAATIPIQLAGQEFQLSPLTDRDIQELNNWLQSQVIQAARGALTDDMAQDQRDEILGAAVREASKVSWFSADGARRMRTIEGVSRILWQSLKRLHPSLTPDKVKDMVLDPATVTMAMAAFRKVNDVPEKKRGETPEGSPKERSRRRGR
jgi:hypothetical protein